ncbi:hypothetical protein ACHAWU_000076 [Discostella pseudostelligera]|uniref:Phosphatidylinositol-3,4,5-trisphosphate 3-phosphatase n=1 Tax=Discostella pseudostelligera TaxID=259834 RepID=A0ABD3MC76_9STRA
MWSSLGDRLASLGDAITQGATASAHANQTSQQNYSNTAAAGAPASVNATSAVGATMVNLPPLPSNADDTAGEAAAIAAAGDAAAATTAAVSDNDNNDNDNQPPQPAPLPRWATHLATSLSDKQNQQAMFGSIRNWTSTIAESTKHIVEEAQRTIEKEQARIQATAPSLFSKGDDKPYKRDLSLPLDVEALRDAEVVYITDRIVTLSHPYMQSTTDGDITANRKLAAVGHLLQQRHGGRYMVWNISEVEYDTSVLDDQVLVYKFPGSPSPPLGLLLKLLMSMESWLKADERNVAVIHCLTGRGRTSTVLAAFLCWTGEAGFTDVNLALEYIAQCKRISVQSLTIPSQVRYASYFANMLDGVRPSQPPLLLKRIIMSEAPKFGKRLANSASSGDLSSEDNADAIPSSREALSGCAPYLQLFKAGNLVFTTAASVNYAQTKDDLPFCSTADGPVSFLIETVLQGDVLLRCRHLTKSGQRVSMFRAAFHTGYVPPKVLRLTKAQLDGACGDKRFADDFFLDLIFEPCDAATATKHLMNDKVEGGGGGGEVESEGEDGAANEAAERRSMGTAGVAGSNNVVSATSYDTMLHRDSRFWDVIAKRREENMKKQAELEKKGEEAKKVEDDTNTPLFGPTIGRRRHFVRSQATSASVEDKSGSSEAGNSNAPPTDRMNAFSIGEDFGLNSPSKSATDASDSKARPLEIPVTPQPKEKDALMEALMDLEDDGLDDEGEVLFDGGDSDGVVEVAAVTDVSDVPTTILDMGASKSSIADDLSALTADVSPDTQGVATDPNAIDATSSENKTPSEPFEVSDGQSEQSATDDADILPDIEQLDDEMAGLDVGDINEGFDDADNLGEFDDFDDLDNDADLEDLEVSLLILLEHSSL